MLAFVSLFVSLLLVSSTAALPVSLRTYVPQKIKYSPFGPAGGLLCSIPHPVFRGLCPRQSSSPAQVSTPLGTAHGVADTAGAIRFSVTYGSASRWQPSTLATSWTLPNGASDPSTLPLPCPQDGLADGEMSEDCLSMILYVPESVKSGSNAPIFMWIHGGSFISGSASGPGLDGSQLATATDSIVAVIQYRLGAFGFMSPNSVTNNAVKDVINALHFLQKVGPSFGGDASKITIAGQSSGANMIRALLATPSASALFQSAILESDPMDYGLLTPSTQQALQADFNSQVGCSSGDTGCFGKLSIDTILAAQDNTSSDSTNIAPSAAGSEPIRPVRDGSLITSPLDLTAAFPAQSKPILLTNVKDEATVEIYGQFDFNVDAPTYEEVVDFTFGEPRTDRILNTSTYAVPASDVNDANADLRPSLNVLGTDQIWRCATYTFARLWAGSGGKAYVGQFLVGATYPGNEQIAQCLVAGTVCHQDDIEIVFGTTPSPDAAQAALTTEIQARYKAFMNTGVPNAAGYATWTQATTADDVHVLELGGTGEADIGTCTTSYWGDYVQYDYQVFDD